MKGRSRRTTRKAKKTLTSTVKKLERIVKEEQPEMKFQLINTTSLTSVIRTAPQLILLNGLLQGTDELNNRIGAKVRWKFINLKYAFKTVIATLPAGSTVGCRCILVWDKMPQGVAIPLANLLYDANPYALSQKDYVTRSTSRFNIIYDKTHWISNFGGNSQVGYAEKYIKLNTVSEYPRNTFGDIRDIDKNSFYLIFISDSLTAGGVTVDYSYCLGFIDP